MARTIQEIRVPRGVDEVRNVVGGWLNANEFKVLEWQATGAVLTHWHVGARWKLTPRQGCIVAIASTAMSNAVAIEATLVPEGGGTLVHAEFYVPPTGMPVTLTKEMDVAQDAVNAMIPRRRGYQLMVSFMQTLGQMGGAPYAAPGAPQPMPQQAPGGGQAPMPYAGGPPAPQPPAQVAPQPLYQQMAPQQHPQYAPQPAAQPMQAQPPSTTQTQALMPPQRASQAPSQMPQPNAGAQPQQAAPPQVFFCMHCGMQLTSAAKFCVRCGKQTVLPD